MSTAKPLSLSDFGVDKIDVTITTDYGRTVKVPLMLLTWHQWNQPMLDIADVPIPLSRRDAANNLQPNPNDTRYVQKMSAIYSQRNAQRLVMSLVGAGNTIPGDTLEEQTNNLMSTMDVGISNALLDVLQKAVNRSKTEASALADTFHDVPTDGEPDTDTTEQDA